MSLSRKRPVKPLPFAFAALPGLPLSAFPHGSVAHDPASDYGGVRVNAGR